MLTALPDRPTFRLAEFARAIGVHVATVHRWRLRGVRGHRLKTYLLGGRRCVDRVDAIAFLAAVNDTNPPAPVTDAADRADRKLDRMGF
jgi:hypothetical protein